MLDKTLTENDAQAISRFVAACEDGKRFYTHAAKEVTERDLRALFLDQATLREEVENVLSPEYEKRMGRPLKHKHTLEGKLTEWYADLKVAFLDPAKSNYVLVEQLEEAEERTLVEMQKAIHAVDDHPLKNKMNELLTRMIKSQQDILQYKEAMRAAS
ncbi:DUF2383 domain-containing protein [Pokkaliibacter sp. MBI-7]|uniref:DUF2383 domain-containing protein n=1 Tax=Pokkaliibacter sp. MBI-7 TaxID=3040600 RepID=UPI00244C0B92|nr:DUF2383 domain-containing protein [Pokkaliibacter sp. MBI-7]MDH2436223.1 DUF2383 domain-containing protein [Pokkaliibacter sp. MBI-7]